MCGLGGIIPAGRDASRYAPQLRAMLGKLRHRGPDGDGTFIDERGHLGFVHARLSILDLSSAGRQPMTSGDGRWTIVFNGEIYNFRDLRAELVRDGVCFRSQSDTEVLLEIFRRDGVSCLQRLDGMFSFAIWDRDEETLFLARDALGIKPLYIWEAGGSLAFASELRAVLTASFARPQLEPQALARYLLFGSVQEPDGLLFGVKALPAGCYLVWRNGSYQINRYWQPVYSADGPSGPDAIAHTRTALMETVQRHMVSDVDVGLFLSGGMDSTAILSLIKLAGMDLPRTFCISFDDQVFNEGDDASRTAKHFGSEHIDYRLRPADARKMFAEFLECIDVPTCDGFNTWCISKLARQHGLKVVLSGVGGDELFGKYPSYRQVPRLMNWHRLVKLAGPFRGSLVRLFDFVARRSHVLGGRTVDRLSTFLASAGNPMCAYWAVRAFFTPKEVQILIQQYCGTSIFRIDEFLAEAIPDQPSMHDSVSYLETTRYLRNQLLRDSDSMSMSHGLELRTPLVDRRLFDSINCIPAGQRLLRGRELLGDAIPEIPDWVTNARKRGFRFPLQEWVSCDWKDQFSELERSCPIRLETWYRKWALFTLHHFLHRNQVESGLSSTRGLRPAGEYLSA